MAALNPLRIVHQSCAIYADPTSLASASGYGTCLGYVKDLEFRFNKRNQAITAEEWGGKTVDVIDLGTEAIIAGILRGTDPDALGKVFPNTATGSTSYGRLVKLSAAGSDRAGASLFASAFKLLFAPDDTDRGEFIVIYKAIPLVDEAAAMQLRLGAEIGIAVAFWGAPDTTTGTTKAVAQIGKREAISLIPP